MARISEFKKRIGPARIMKTDSATAHEVWTYVLDDTFVAIESRPNEWRIFTYFDNIIEDYDIECFMQNPRTDKQIIAEMNKINCVHFSNNWFMQSVV